MHELAARLARGEEAAFAELYDACADRLHHYVAVRLGSRDAAADVVQRAFLRAVKSRRRFRGVENPVAYMFQIARNEAARAAKRDDTSTSTAGGRIFAAAGDASRTEMMRRWCGGAGAAGCRRSGDGGAEDFRRPDVSRDCGCDRPAAGNGGDAYRRALESLRGWLAKQFR